MDKPLYYRTRVMDLDAPEIVAVCDDLLSAAGYAPQESYDYPLWRWLSWFFQEQPPKKITAKLFLPGSPLITPISKFADTPLHVFCVELTRERHVGLEMFSDGNLLTLLKTIYRKDQLSPSNSRR